MAANDKPVFIKKQGKNFSGDRNFLQTFKDLLSKKGVIGWNRWLYRSSSKENSFRNSEWNLRGIDLSGLNLSGINLRGIELSDADFTRTNLIRANLSDAHLWQTKFDYADLTFADFTNSTLNYSSFINCKLHNARVVSADLTCTNFKNAKLIKANLAYSNLGGADLRGANLMGATVTGTNTWDVLIDSFTKQENLIIEQWDDPLLEISDDSNSSRDNIILQTNDIEVAQLLYLLTRRNANGKSEKLKNVIDAMTDRIVLILGNFGLRRKSILKAMREKLANNGYVPVIFDFEPPNDRDLIETVGVLAGLSRFVIADLTSPSSTPLEALLIISGFKVPFATIVLEGKKVFSMFNSLKAKYDWVLQPWQYKNKKHLVNQLERNVIIPCEKMRQSIARQRKAAQSSTPNSSALTNVPRK